MNARPTTRWGRARLGDLLEFSNGVNAGRSAFGSGIPFANVLEVITHESLREEQIPGRVALPTDTQRRYEVRRGDVLFNRTSETQNEVGLSSVYLGENPIVFGGFVFRARPISDRLDLGYAKYALRSSQTRAQIVARGQGGIRANIGQRDLKSVEIPIPPLSVQRAIADSLDAASDLISTLQRLLSKKQAMKQGMMQQLLTGHTRLPGFAGEWSEVTFEDLATPVRERVDPRSVVSATALIELEHIASGSGRIVGSSTAGDAVSLKTVFRPGDVLFGKLRAYLRKYWLADRDGVCSTEIWALRARPHVAGAFVRYVVESDRFIETASGGYGTHMPRSDWGIVRKFALHAPSRAEQDAIAQVLLDADAEIATLHDRIAKARAVKTGMTQQLLSGEISPTAVRSGQ